MNSELQAQSDAITGAIRHLETTLSNDMYLVGGILAFLLVALIVTRFRR
jgi:hypothetical protein